MIAQARGHILKHKHKHKHKHMHANTSTCTLTHTNTRTPLGIDGHLRRRRCGEAMRVSHQQRREVKRPFRQQKQRLQLVRAFDDMCRRSALFPDGIELRGASLQRIRGVARGLEEQRACHVMHQPQGEPRVRIGRYNIAAWCGAK